MSTTFLTLTMAIISLGLGLSLYLWSSTRPKHQNLYTTILISWLLIALFPVILIFSFFPGSSASGNIFGFSIAGAIAAFILIWWRGTTSALQANKLDALEENFRTLEIELQTKTEETRKPIPLQKTETFVYRLKKKKRKKIALITGSIEAVTIADVWVSSENTNMEMSRFYENSVSGIIRYYGAKKDPFGNVTDDIIVNELTQIKAGSLYVQPATVLVTNAGELQHTHNVKKIFHVASVQGEVGRGYQPIQNIQYCVRNALNKAGSEELKSIEIKSILFPLLSTGTANGNLPETAQKLIQSALSFMASTNDSSIEYIYFLAWTDKELEVCQNILENSEQLIKLSSESKE